MDGIVHTYKDRLVAKGYTQTYGVDYEETFSPVADIRAVRILIAIAAFYDYKIWQMDIKTAFLNGYLDENIYMVKPKGFVVLNILEKMDTSKRGYIPMQERLDLNKTQGASILEDVKCMQNVPYASVVGSIMYAVRCTRPDVAFAQNITSCFQQNPGEPHWTAMKTILKDDTKSQTGYVLILNGGVIDWKISKQSTTMMSATEAEYIAALEASMKLFGLGSLFQGLKGARHYHKRYHYVRECIELGDINLRKVRTYDNLSDPFTKALSKVKLAQHARIMRLHLAGSFM
ncbi:retrotransposon protein, putative, ty1-copia subclass [Tanacetum coccineum]